MSIWFWVLAGLVAWVLVFLFGWSLMVAAARADRVVEHRSVDVDTEEDAA